MMDVLFPKNVSMNSRTSVDMWFNFMNWESTDKPERKRSVKYVEDINLIA